MQSEMTSMNDFQVYDEVPISNLSPEEVASAVSSRWVITWKGTWVKCRLVARGFEQIITDVDDTYASAPVFVIMKVLIAIALALQWCIMTCDVSTAFLHADLDEATPLFMWPPKEYYPQGGILWRLKKAMCGLKGAPRAWQEHFASTLQSLGFTRLRSDANVYVHFQFMIVILAYVMI